MNNIKSRIVENFEQWHNSRGNVQPKEEEAKEASRFNKEVQKLEDTFERISRLDGTPEDDESAPGKVVTLSPQGIVTGRLQKTDDGFLVSETKLTGNDSPSNDRYHLGGDSAEILPQTTTYEVVKDEGIVRVRNETRKAFSADISGYILDLNQGLVRDE